ncbi:GTP 3',8-cyclase, partial [Phenoliferia sp. Uapishka_3]
MHSYLRISLTEKCNLRCTYCMPEAGVPLLPPTHLLTTPEIERVAKLFVSEGVTKIRLTGGEPTVRKDLLDVVQRLGKLPLESLGMTSNGIALKRKLPALVEAGLTHLNISLDTLDPFQYELITRRRGYDAVMDALEVAKGLSAQGLRTKINCVIIRASTYSSSSSPDSPPRLTHIDPATGKASMVSVSEKSSTRRSATAVGSIYLGPTAFSLVVPSATSTPSKKGDVLAVAQLAGLLGAKATPSLIPLCHPISLSHVSVTLTPNLHTHSIDIVATAECVGPTGVEMEALMAVSTSALTVWDMCKSAGGKEMSVGGIKVVRKAGGRSGDWVRSHSED